MGFTIEELQIDIQGNSDNASKSLEKLTQSLNKLKSVVGAGSDFSGLGKIANQLQPLNNLNLKINVTGLKKLAPVLAEVSKAPSIETQMESLVKASEVLQQLGKNNLNSFLNSLKKIPEVSDSLSKLDMTKFAQQIKMAADAVRPLADEMEKVSRGFQAFPIRIQKIIQNNEKWGASNRKLDTSLTGTGNKVAWLLAKINLYVISAGRAANVVTEWIMQSNQYQENLNLFAVTMGETADEAFRYAQAVERIMGVDSSEWMRYQGVFQQILDGFGVIGDKADVMSRNLTQMIYDSASFFNTSIETAATKYQSGIAGELEPLRRWGYALDQATLKQTALNHGLNINLNEITQAQKALLRYVTIMEQSSNIVYDMGRTLETPANALRILNQRIIMLKRALGNSLIPIIIEVIPYVQAFAQVFADAANAVANFLGFELTEIDYSQNIDNVTNLGKSYEDLNEEVTAYKRAMVGIDEINVLGKTREVSDKENGLGNFDLDISLPDVNDWLGEVEGRGQELYDEVKKIVDKVTPLLIAFGTVFAISKITSATTGIGKFVKTFAPLVGFQNSFAAALNNGTGKLSAFKAGMKGFRGEIPLMAKALIGAGGAVVAFNVFKESIYNVTSGTSNLKNELPKLALVFGAVGTVLNIFLGPVGWVITAVGALTGVLVGHAKNVREQALNELYDDIGLSASELRSLTADLGDEINKQSEVFAEHNNKVQALENKYNEFESSFAMNLNGIRTSTEETGTLIEDIKTNLEGMVSQARSNLETTTDAALTAYAKLALDNDGFISAEEQKILESMRVNLEEKKTRFRGIQDEIYKIYEKASRERRDLTRAEIADIYELTDEMRKLAEFQSRIEINKAQVMIDDIASGRRKISVDNVDDIVAEATTQYKDLYETARDNYATEKALYESTLSGSELQSALSDLQTRYSKQMVDASQHIENVLNAVKQQLKSQMPDTYESKSGTGWWDSFVQAIGVPVADLFIKGDYTKDTAIAWAIKDALEKVEKAQGSTSYGSSGVNGSGGGGGFRSGYATGGFPETGSLFMADENEIEMKGFMGNKPVVVNNQQIIDGIKQGVKEGLFESGGNNGGDWHIQIVDEIGNVKSETVITAAQRKNRRDGKTVLPLGVS
ncbi:MAG TPA: hypothetical protein VFC68_03000 [Treponemataceae bacterium]|nr:hypothetical protein [Treponemataceae bacterium]